MEESLSSKDMVEAQAHLWRHTFSFINSMCLRCAVELGIPDAIHSHGRPITLPEICTVLSIPIIKQRFLRRLMDLLVQSSFFARHERGEEQEEDSFSLTVNSRILLRENGEHGSGSASAFILVMLDEVMLSPWSHLTAWLKMEDGGAGCPFELGHGRSIWEVADNNTVFSRMFNEAMEGDTPLSCGFLKEEGMDIFGSLRSLVDVGGGTGTFTKFISEAFPLLKCTVLDLPHVVDTVEKQIYAGVEYIAGDMFKHIPSADAVLLKWILHAWNDDDCVRILTRCKDATPTKSEGGKVIVIDMVRGGKCGERGGDHTEMLWDLHMMTQTRGKQRSEEEWKSVFMAAGFKEYNVVPILGIRGLILLYH